MSKGLDQSMYEARQHTAIPPRSVSGCQGRLFAVLQPPVRVQPPEPPGPSDRSPLSLLANHVTVLRGPPLPLLGGASWCSHSSRGLPSGRDVVLLVLASQPYCRGALLLEVHERHAELEIVPIAALQHGAPNEIGGKKNVEEGQNPVYEAHPGRSTIKPTQDPRGNPGTSTSGIGKAPAIT